MMESLPRYIIEDQTPTLLDAYNVLLTRISDSLTGTHFGSKYSAPLEAFLQDQNPPLYSSSAKKQETSEPIQIYPQSEIHGPTELTRVKQQIVKEFFASIEREDNEAVALLIGHNLVTANTINETGCTPLLTAIQTSTLHLVKQLLELGADPNAFGNILNSKSKSSIHTPLLAEGNRNSYTIRSSSTNSSHRQVSRTPIMLAAQIGSLPIVKLLFEAPHSANDALVASDGQIALRLAAASNHTAVVEYLPSRRGGGFLRFKTRNAKNIQRIKAATIKIGWFVKGVVWHVPKFIVWDIPKYCVVIPTSRLIRHAWKNKKYFGAWCRKQLVMVGTELCNVVKALPEALVEIAKWLWRGMTVGIPTAVLTTLKWVWFLTTSIARGVWNIVRSVASLMHATLVAFATFLHNVTLKDVWNAFVVTVRAIFVGFPVAIWSAIRKLGDVSYRIMKSLFGLLGEIIWSIGAALVWLVTYIPKKLWVILRSIGSSFAHAGHEVVVWINPKAQ